MAQTTAASIGFGTIFERDNGVTYDAIAEITSVTPPQLSRETVDATNMGSAGRYREFISGLRDAGEVALEINWVPSDSTYQLIVGDLDADDCVGYRITLPDTTTVDFEGLVTAVSPSTPLEDKMTASITIKVLGAPVWAYAA